MTDKLKQTDKLNTLKLRQSIIDTRYRFQHGEATQEELYLACDLYRLAIQRYARQTKKKIRIPSRAYLIRAL